MQNESLKAFCNEISALPIPPLIHVESKCLLNLLKSLIDNLKNNTRNPNKQGRDFAVNLK